jgi:hypothetical protein
MDERDFFDEKESRKPHTLTCPHCRQAGEYELSWLVRTKKKHLSGRADEPDRTKFAIKSQGREPTPKNTYFRSPCFVKMS